MELNLMTDESDPTQMESDRVELILDIGRDGYFYMHPDGSQTLYNHQFYSKFDIDLADTRKSFQNWLHLVHDEDKYMLTEAVLQQKSSKQEMMISRYRVLNRQHEYLWIESYGRTVLDSNGNVEALIGYHTEVPDLRIHVENVSELAYKDPLTGLYNRNKAVECMEEMKLTHKGGYLLYIDIENFKSINTLLGYEIGDEVIRYLSKMLQAICPGEYMLSRNYGAEFMILSCFSDLDVFNLAQKVLSCVQAPIWMLDKYLVFEAKICIYPIHKDESTSDRIIQKSQMMISAMKGQGESILYYDPQVELQYTRKLNIDRFMRGGLSKHEFYVIYQPIYNINTGQIEGFEALLRWYNELLGYVTPDEFIPIAEKNHTINDLGNFVLANACRFIKEMSSDTFTPYVSVNVSPVQLNQLFYLENTLEIIDTCGADRHQIVVEVTESVTLEESGVNKLEVLRQLNKEGLKLAIDDFGTGYSSLNSIITLPLSYLKIDKSLVQGTNTNPESLAMIELLVNFSLRTNYKIIAEGIEDQLVHETMRDIGVTCGQGFLYSRPMTKGQLIENVKASPSYCNLFEILY